MKIQNITGVSKLFSLGRRSMQLAIGEVVNIQDDPAVVDAVMKHAREGFLKVIEGPADSQVLRSKTPFSTIAIRCGAFARWANNDHLALNGVKFEADTDSTRTVTGSVLVALGADIAAWEANLVAAFAANASALAAAGLTYLGKKTVNSLSTMFFKLDTTVVPVADSVVAFTNAGGSGTAPTVITASAVDTQNTSVCTVDILVPAGKTSVAVKLPYDQLLGTPQVTARNSSGVLQSAPTVNSDGPFLEITGLTAGHTATIVAFCR